MLDRKILLLTIEVEDLAAYLAVLRMEEPRKHVTLEIDLLTGLHERCQNLLRAFAVATNSLRFLR
jgi:hypothetical protein